MTTRREKGGGETYGRAILGGPPTSLTTRGTLIIRCLPALCANGELDIISGMALSLGGDDEATWQLGVPGEGVLVARADRSACLAIVCKTQRADDCAGAILHGGLLNVVVPCALRAWPINT